MNFQKVRLRIFRGEHPRPAGPVWRLAKQIFVWKAPKAFVVLASAAADALPVQKLSFLWNDCALTTLFIAHPFLFGITISWIPAGYGDTFGFYEISTSIRPSKDSKRSIPFLIEIKENPRLMAIAEAVSIGII